MKSFTKNLSFFAIDIDRLFLHTPQDMLVVAEAITHGLEAGYLKPIPTKVFAAKDINRAFDYMAQSRHIGKIVVEFHNQHVPIITSSAKQDIIQKQATYLITGGTRGFGLALAKWLANKGVKRLILMGRTGVYEETTAAIKLMQKMGTEVLIAKVDVTDENQLKQWLASINFADLPLRGIFHAAMILEDGFVSDINRQRSKRVLAPKIRGAINLYQLTSNLPLDFLVFFSSLSALIGNSGQIDYIIANSFLDFFAQYLSLKGLRALSVNWDMILDTGIVTRHDYVIKLLSEAGINGLTSLQALQGLDEILNRKTPAQVGIFNIDWQKWVKTYPASLNTVFYEQLIKKADEKLLVNKSFPLEQIASLSNEEIDAKLISILCKVFSKVLKIQLKDLNVHSSITNLGIDSLLVVELVRALKDELGIMVAVIDLLSGPTITQLAKNLASKFVQPEMEKSYA